MRSCEYLKTSHQEDSKRTKILRLKNIRFKKGDRIFNHWEDKLLDAELVVIILEFQKNDKRNRRVHMFRTNEGIMCPVVAWASTVKRIVNTIPGAKDDTKVCSYWDGGSIKEIDSSHTRMKIKDMVELIGEKVLGFTKDDVGLHSVRSGGAMAMFLSGISEIIIQRIGRWETFAFLDYIREQVEDFTNGVSKKMLQFETFQHINEKQIETKQNTLQKQHTKEGDGDTNYVPLSIRFSRSVLDGEDNTQNIATSGDNIIEMADGRNPY